MKDEEKRIFEEWFEEKKEKCEVYGNGDDFWVDDEIKKFCLMGYEQGLKAGRPKLHYLTENPNDLPKNCKSDFILCFRGGTHYRVGFFNGLRFICYGGDYDDVIAWCEIPTFDKE